MKSFIKKFSALAVALISLLAPAQNIALAQYGTYTGPSATPPGNNPLGPVWLQGGTVNPQSGSISISQNEWLGMDLFMTNNRAIRADLNTGPTTLYMSNYGTGANGFTLNVRGNLRLDGSIAGTPGNIYVPQICLGAAGSEVCRTTWPSSGGGVSGTPNYIPKFITATTLGDSLLYDDGTGRIGLGTTTPSAVFDVRSGGERMTVADTGYGVNAVGTAGGGNFRHATQSGAASVGFGHTGVNAVGNTAGGHFRDSDSTGDAYVGYGNIGVQGTGSTAGGYFVATDGSYGYAGYTGYGMLGYGNTAGGYFYNNGSGSEAAIANGAYGLVAYGRTGASGAYIANIDAGSYAYIGRDNNRGVDAYGSSAGVYGSGGVTGIQGSGTSNGVRGDGGSYGGAFYGNSSGVRGYNLDGSGYGGEFYGGDTGVYANGTTYGVSAVGPYGILARGTTMGGRFEDADGTGSASVGYSGYGINASGDTMGAYFADTNNGTSASIAYASYSFYGSGTFYNTGSSQIAGTLTVSGLTVNGSASMTGSLTVTNTVTGGYLSVTNSATVGRLISNGYITAATYITAGTYLDVAGTVYAGDGLSVTGSASISGNISADNNTLVYGNAQSVTWNVSTDCPNGRIVGGIKTDASGNVTHIRCFEL